MKRSIKINVEVIKIRSFFSCQRDGNIDKVGGNSKFCKFFPPSSYLNRPTDSVSKNWKISVILFQTSAKPVSPSRHSTHMCFNSLFNCPWGGKFLIFRKLHISIWLMDFFNFPEVKKTVKMLRARLFFISFFEGILDQISFQNNSFIYSPLSPLFNNLLISLINKLELCFLIINSLFFTYHWRDKKTQLKKEQTELPRYFTWGCFFKK
jgi:hypothetical protein